MDINDRVSISLYNNNSNWKLSWLRESIAKAKNVTQQKLIDLAIDLLECASLILNENGQVILFPQKTPQETRDLSISS